MAYSHCDKMSAVNGFAVGAQGSETEVIDSNGNANVQTKVVFEGATADAYETTLTVVDPTADRTVTIPDTTGTVITSGDSATVKKGMISYEVVAVTVAAAATSGTGTCTADSIILGYYPTSNQDQFVDSIAVSGTTVTVTLAAAATADNVFNVVMLKA